MKLKDTIHFNWYRHLFVAALILICLYASVAVTDADFGEVFGNVDQMTSFLSRFLKPDFTYIPQIVGPMIDTLKVFFLYD